jgi:hypothetical protein
MLFKKTLKPVIATVATAAFLAGCAAPGAPGASGATGTPTATASFGCNPAVTAGIGAVLGGLIGGGSNTVRGAAIGAGLGALACVALNYQSEQIKTSQQVERDYKAANKGKLPEQATLVKYETAFIPASVRPGQKAQTNSYIEVVPGTKDANPLVEEEITLYKPDGSTLTSARKQLSATNSTGAFKGGFGFPMPEGVPQGVYPVKTALYLNRAKVSGQDMKLQVVRIDGMSTTILALAN